MKYSLLCRELESKGIRIRTLHGEQDPSLENVVADHRQVSPGSLFCCIRGKKHDGRDFAELAAAAGAAAFLCEEPLSLPFPQILVSDIRKSLGYVAAALEGYPAEKLRMFAVTGTNGKTSSTYLLRSIFQAAGETCGLLGTITYNDGMVDEYAERTTPEASDIQHWLARMVRNRCSICVLEASSHGLMLGRLRGCLFEGALFTNLTSEHLDFHGTMEDYFEAKTLLFDEYTLKGWKGAVNVDDAYGRRLLSKYGNSLLGFGCTPGNGVAVYGSDISSTLEGVSGKLHFPGKSPIAFSVPLAGKFSLANALGAAALAYAVGIDPEMILVGLRNVPQIPGRMERFRTHSGFACIIDYAHSPDAMEKVLCALREICSGRIIVVFGSGGERYAENRPLIGKIMAELADRIVVTMDNPRNEDPAAIAQQNLEGIREAGGEERALVILEREEAVRTALDAAGPGDIVLLAGKGPERYILRENRRIPYSDKDAFLRWAKDRSISWE
ncbi:UDP-N-acetylmuramoyl-L-alanyl-D-glutamate--2,6-diaminopimelate ligase [Aminiphilus circumscriptus]|uniref:UDP-N-acetylmuramoyl-L-alanyl-D-glutamate--2, 6-diaminopimelate ligase n=1 Tax=Aminiphilus circumscriptus TaxID=290732 RepID=UPI000492DD10|nr:UDP-N-acetylmuramoyl-L-alanyl-D-glutamate--2,6-diaminopimelate ligase [Aminiphilus circumscriptus]